MTPRSKENATDKQKLKDELSNATDADARQARKGYIIVDTN